MSAKAKARPHTWSGAGYVCADCGAIKDTDMEREPCTGSGKTGFDVWLYRAGAGWWLDEQEMTTVKQAAKRVAQAVGTENVMAGAVLPAGLPLGLFTKRYGK